MILPYHCACLCLLSLLLLSVGFHILSYSPTESVLTHGQTVSLLCQADSDWEFCLWKHSSKEQEEARECLMEWKRAKGGVAVQSCDSSLVGRISISGDYSSHQCGLSISDIQLEDAGTWEC